MLAVFLESLIITLKLIHNALLRNLKYQNTFYENDSQPQTELKLQVLYTCKPQAPFEVFPIELK